MRRRVACNNESSIMPCWPLALRGRGINSHQYSAGGRDFIRKSFVHRGRLVCIVHGTTLFINF